MGVNDRERDKKDTAKRRSEEKRRLRSSSGVGATPADWENCDGQLLAKCIATVAAQGGALRFGYTSDGGAYSVGVYGDGKPYTVYLSPKEDLNDWLRGAIEDFSK